MDIYSPHIERRYVTRKRMERRTPDGQLLSVTNMRTVHYNDPHGERSYPNQIDHERDLPHPPPRRHRSYSVSHPRYSSETLKRNSVEYVEPPFVRTEPSFEEFNREDVYQKLHVSRYVGMKSCRSEKRIRPPATFSPRRRQETVTWKRREAFPDPNYETLDWNSDRERREPIYFGREEDRSGSSQLHLLLDRINDIRRRNGKRELVPDSRLAAQAGRWAEWIVRSGEFRRDINEKMNVWRGNRVSAEIANNWYEEAIEFRTSRFIDFDWLRIFGAGAAYWPEKNVTVVVVIYD